MKLMAHAKELQASAVKMKEELPNMEFTSTAANGGISVTVTGDFRVKNIDIAPEMFNDKVFLEKELTDALNSAFGSARSAMQERMQAVTGSLGIDIAF